MSGTLQQANFDHSRLLCGNVNESQPQGIKHQDESFPEEYHTCIHHIFEQQVELRPGALAVCAWDGNLTYDELDDLSSRMSIFLRAAGVRPGSYVPFCFEKSRWTVVATAAILKAGGAYVPLDPLSPRGRLLEMIAYLGASIVLVAPSCKGFLADNGSGFSRLVKEASSSSDCESQFFHIKIMPHDPAVVLFTSGSTGRPKAIVLTHAAIATNARSHGEALSISSDSRVLQYAAHVWDVATMDIWTTLMRGGCVCVPSEDERRSDIAGAMERMQVDWALLTPSLIDLIQPSEVPHLQVLVSAGEPMTQNIISTWSDKVRLFNAFGPAETGVCTAVEYKSKTDKAENIGLPLAANICWVADVDDHNKLVPIGSVGELLVEGPNLTLGYLGNEAKTQSQFIESPHFLRWSRSRRFRRLYKTGDLVRYNQNNYLEFKGRKDRQIKIRGQRVELGAVEHSIEMHPKVLRAAAFYPQQGLLSNKLVCVVHTGATSHRGPGTDSGQDFSFSARLYHELKHFLETRTPSYMIPDVIIQVQALPLALSGKVDRIKLQDWLLMHHRQEEAFPSSTESLTSALGKPLAEIESTTSRLKSELLKVIGDHYLQLGVGLIDDDTSLAAIGINSIQYMKLIASIRRTWSIKTPLSLLTGPTTTVREVAEFIDSDSNLETAQEEQSETRLLNEVSLLVERLKCSSRSEKPLAADSARDCPFTALLTGSTGFLGAYILLQLLANPKIRHVITHVRADSEGKAIARVVDSATKAGGWQEKYRQKLEVWVGDLAKPRLGVSQEQWARLLGKSNRNVNLIIHAGAKVHWINNYDSLKPVNVDSTVQLLQASLESTSISRFVYVSGGQQLRMIEGSDRKRAKEAACFNGYGQTKLVSELMVRDAGRLHQELGFEPSRFQVVKPAYVIGAADTGLANPEDFLWRLTYAVVEANGYDQTEEDDFLFVCPADQVAMIIIDTCLLPTKNRASSILDGLTMGEFWGVLRKHYPGVQPLSQADWMRRLDENITVKGEKHPLYPFKDTETSQKLSVASPSSERGSQIHSEQIKQAVSSNVAYLISLGFLPSKVLK